MYRKQPFREKILNISNSLSEAIVLLILILLSILSSNLSKKNYDQIDNSLVILVNVELAIQTSSSLLIFIRTIYFFIKKKMRKNSKVRPEAQFTSQIEITEKELPKRCNSPVLET